MIVKRIIPCLDVKNGRVVKGVHFEGLRDAGAPVELGLHYDKTGADELVFLDISASQERRRNSVELAGAVAKTLFIPFTIGGGITSIEDIRMLLRQGADKVSINSAALANPDFINQSSRQFGKQCIVVAIDFKRSPDSGESLVYSHGGSVNTGREAAAWAKEAEERGAGEILLTSMDADGLQSGFDLDITRRISENASIPVIASGGGGKPEHFYEVLSKGKADAVLAASVFHFGLLTINQLKSYLYGKGVPVRME